MDLKNNFIKKVIYIGGKKPTFTPDEIQGYDMSNYVSEQTYNENSEFPVNNIYINIFLTKTYEVFEYVDTKKDEKIYSVDRQLINPYFIEYGFFNNVKRIKVNQESDLTLAMKNYLNTAYTESINGEYYQGDVSKWFNEIGYNTLINDLTTKIDVVTGKKSIENGLDRLEKLEYNVNSIISKASFFPISVNK